MEKKIKYIIIALVVLVLFGGMIVMAFLALPLLELWSTTTTRDRQPAQIAQDKSVCAAAGIELLSYTERYENVDDASGNMQVKYMGNTLTCHKGGRDGLDSSCKIGTSVVGEGWLLDHILISVSKDKCELFPATD